MVLAQSDWKVKQNQILEADIIVKKKTLAKLKFSLYATFITFDLSPPRYQSRNRNRCQQIAPMNKI